MTNIICIKWGTAYPAHYVNRLYAMVARNLKRPFRFACFTAEPEGIRPEVEIFPIPPLNVPRRDNEPWRKVALFAPQLGDLAGPSLFLDLDVLVTGGVDDLFDLPGEFCIIENWTQKGRGIGNSSVFRFTIGAHPEIYHRFQADPDTVLDAHVSEQEYVSRMIGPRLTYWPEDWVVSFKEHCIAPYPLRPFIAARAPENARVVAFHGHPKMDEAAEGRWPGKWYKLLGPSPWINDVWRE